MENKNVLQGKLKIELMQARMKIESGDDNLPIALGLPGVLYELEKELDKNSPDREMLEKGTYGIFRLITESYSFEKSVLGQELLSLRLKIKDFASTLTMSK